MGSGPSHEDDQGRLRAKVLAIGALTPRSKTNQTRGSSSVREFIEAQKRSKEELWKEIQAQYDKNQVKREEEVRTADTEQEVSSNLMPIPLFYP